MNKKNILLILVVLCCQVALGQQRLQVIDTDGLPIPYVCVTDARGALVGTTDEEGWVENKKGAKDLYFSHIAFQATNIQTDTLASGRVVMRDVDFGLGEVTVKPKELAYIQTYYRLIYLDDEGPLYFRGGVIDNTYEFANKKSKSKKRNLSRGENGLLRFLISTLVGRYIDQLGQVSDNTTYKQVLNGAKAGELTLVGDSLGRQIISDSICTLGYIDTDLAAGLRTTSFNKWAYSAHKKEAEQRAKGKEKKKNQVDRHREESFYEVYRIDEEGRSRVDDFVMRQMHVSADQTGSDGRYVILLQAYTTARNYIDKKELKQTRKENEVEMDIRELRQFEEAHNIPELPPNVKAAVDKLFEKELGKEKN